MATIALQLSCSDRTLGAMPVGTSAVPTATSADTTATSEWAEMTPCDPEQEIVYEGSAVLKSLSDIEPLIGAQCLTGGIFLEYYEDASLKGLESLTRTMGGIFFERNDALTDLSALSGLREVGGLVHINENPSLRSLEGLHSVHTIFGSLTIGEIPSEFPGDWPGNPALETIDGLRGLRALEGEYRHILIGDNGSLTDVSGLAGLARVERLEVVHNNMLPGAAVDVLAAAINAEEVIHCANLDDGSC